MSTLSICHCGSSYYRVVSIVRVVNNSIQVVARFVSDENNAIIGFVNHIIRSRLDATPQFVTSFLGQLMQQVVAETVESTATIMLTH